MKDTIKGAVGIKKKSLLHRMLEYKHIYVILLPTLLYYLIFKYAPMFGNVIAFQDYSITRGIMESPFVGLENFKEFLTSYKFGQLLKNTLSINLWDLLLGFTSPILLALLLNEVRHLGYKKAVQTITYMPHFISTVVVSSLILTFVSTDGLINGLRGLFGAESIAFMSEPKYFYAIYVLSGIWQQIGWSSIIYIAAISSVSAELYEAATIDGAESYVQAFAPMVATGPKNSYISMCRNTLRQIKEGETINLAAGVSYEGYNGIICSPLVLGEIPQQIKDAVMCAYDALNYASDKMVPGTPCDVVLNAYTEYLTKYGYIDYCPYGSLHSTGMLECEAPTFTVSNKRIIEENMAICIDAYFKSMEWGSFRIEDCYLITDKGAKRMTTYNDSAIPKIFK